ncbi:hypothetical protein [Paenibacillus curdlanolyticus]|nr:hypothetical protein [Paenibacillus curdlanolyticus]
MSNCDPSIIVGTSAYRYAGGRMAIGIMAKKEDAIVIASARAIAQLRLL